MVKATLNYNKETDKGYLIGLIAWDKKRKR